MEQIRNIFHDILKNENLVKIIFSTIRKKTLPYKKVVVRAVSLHETIKYQAEYHNETRVKHENIQEEDFVNTAMGFIQNDFKQVNIQTTTSDIQILASKPENPKIYEKSAIREAVALKHDQAKNYIIPNHMPCDFLIRLGVMDEKGNVFNKNYSKFRQINRFLEIVKEADDALTGSGKDADNKIRPIKIIDFGCGKAYLTFALYHYLHNMLGKEVEIIGLDLKEDIVEFCNRVAKDLNYENLKFMLGDIADFKQESADMVVSLHACDTATDYALINAARWGAQVIFAVPCCEHELFEQISSELDDAYLKHGILKDKFTEILTNGLRGLKLESCGYDVSMIEFTSLEHTSKNTMIKAIRKRNAQKERVANEKYEKLKTNWNVNPTIDKLANSSRD
jgi:SAM-dependent methyltransferase